MKSLQNQLLKVRGKPSAHKETGNIARQGALRSDGPRLRDKIVKKASEYRHHAKECRALANQAVSDEHRKQLSAMADTWDTLALERERAAAKDEANFVPAPSSDPGEEHISH